MNPDCATAVSDIIGRNLTDAEERTIDEQMNLHMRLQAQKDTAAWLKLTPQDRLLAGAKAAASSMIAEVQKKQQQLRLQIAAHSRLDQTLAAALDALPPDAKPGAQMHEVSKMLAFAPEGSKFQSADSWSNAIASTAMGNLMDLWKSTRGFLGLFEDRKGVRDIVHEMWGEESGNAAAKKGAATWLKVTDDLRDRANAAGLSIGDLDAWHYPQSWAPARVAGAELGEAGKDPHFALQHWINKQLPRLDRSRYLNPDGTRMSDELVAEKVLGPVFDSITTDGANKIRFGQNPDGQATNKMPAADNHRALFFKSADDYLAAQGDFGNKSLWSTLVGHIHGISREISMAESLGPKPEATFRYFNDRTRLDELRQNPLGADKVNKQHTYNEALYRYVSGHQDVVDQRVADAGQAFRNFETAAKLPAVVITALGDEAGMATTAFANRIPMGENFMSQMHFLNPLNGEDRAVAEHTGLGINRIIQGLNRFGTEDMNLSGGRGFWAGARAATGNMASFVLRATGAEKMWDTRRQGLGSILMSYLGKNVSKFEHLEDAHFQDVGVLKSKGITDKDWQVWRAAEPEDWGGSHGVLTPQSIYNIPDEKLAALGGDPMALRRRAATSLMGHVLEETGMGVMDTGARERAGMFLGTQAGTRGGELTRSAFLFKSFAFSMMHKHWERAAAMPAGSGSAMFNGSGTAQYAATLLVTGTLLGALATQIRNLVGGKDPANIAEPKFWGESFLRGGGLGFYGDFLYSEMTSHDTSLIPAIAGPLATEGEAVWNLTGGALFKKLRGERTDEGGNLVRELRSNVPVANFWYLKAAFDHLIWNQMQEWASPGYLDRMQAKAFATRGTSYYWDPHDRLPTATPDAGKLWQPELGREQVEAAQRIAGKVTGQ